MTPQCYLCHKPTVFLFRKNGYDIVRCPSCQLGMTVLGKEYQQFTKDFYAKGYFTGEEQCAAYRDYQKDKKAIVKNMQHYVHSIQKHAKGKTLLDIGCAYGFLVETAVKQGIDAYGIDVSEFAVTHAPPSVQSRVQQGTIDALPFPKNNFDMVTMIDIFEHLADPIKDLTTLSQYIKKGGHILIATGDAGTILPKLIGRRWTFYIPPQHLMFFHKKHIEKILKKSGFTPKRWFRKGKWVSLGYVLHLAKTTGESTFARWIAPLIEKIGLTDISLYVPVGDNIVVIAEKNE